MGGASGRTQRADRFGVGGGRVSRDGGGATRRGERSAQPAAAHGDRPTGGGGPAARDREPRGAALGVRRARARRAERPG